MELVSPNSKHLMIDESISAYPCLSRASLSRAVQTFELNIRTQSSLGDRKMASSVSGEGRMEVGSEGKARGPEVEEYDCGCRIRLRQLDYGESGEELPRKPVLVQDYIPCVKHKNVQEIPPRDARLIMVRHEHESFLNE